jgi:hypothetical protein
MTYGGPGPGTHDRFCDPVNHNTVDIFCKHFIFTSKHKNTMDMPRVNAVELYGFSPGTVIIGRKG